MITYISHKYAILATIQLADIIRKNIIYARSRVLSDPGGTINQR